MIIIIIIITNRLLITIAVKKYSITGIKYRLQKFTLFNNATHHILLLLAFTHCTLD